MLKKGDGLCYEEVQVGEEIPSQSVELTVPIMVRWCGTAEIRRRVHYDYEYAVKTLKLPNIVGSGWWTQARLFKLLHDWAGDTGWVLRIKHEMRSSLYPGNTVIFSGKVTAKSIKGDFGYVDLDVAARQDDGKRLVPGTATVVLPLRGGRQVPYPFPTNEVN